MILDCYDYETTSVSPKSCEPVQVGVITADIQPDGTYHVLEQGSLYLRIKANKIPPGAQEVHGISIDTVRTHGVDPHEVIPHIGPVVMGYNNHHYDDIISARYGANITQSIDLFIGTARLKNAGLISRAKLGIAYQELTGKPPEGAHDALIDVTMTLALIRPMMAAKEVTSFGELLHWLGNPEANVHMKMPFGKHKGYRLRDLPRSYVRWLLDNTDLRGDLRAGLEATQ